MWEGPCLFVFTNCVHWVPLTVEVRLVTSGSSELVHLKCVAEADVVAFGELNVHITL